MNDAGVCHQGEVLRYERTVGAASAPLPNHRGASYRRHEPEVSPLYHVVLEHLETLLARVRERTEHGFGYPRFVERTFRLGVHQKSATSARQKSAT